MKISGWGAGGGGGSDRSFKWIRDHATTEYFQNYFSFLTNKIHYENQGELPQWQQSHEYLSHSLSLTPSLSLSIYIVGR